MKCLSSVLAAARYILTFKIAFSEYASDPQFKFKWYF